jgi:hypothetical protein
MANITGYSVTVTSPAESSKVLLIAMVPIEIEAGAGSDCAGSTQFFNGTSKIGPEVITSFQDAVPADAGVLTEAWGFMAWIDTPSGTTTYTVQGKEFQDGVQTHSTLDGHFAAIEIPTAEFGAFVSATIDNTSDTHVLTTFTDMTGQTSGSITPAATSTVLCIGNSAVERGGTDTHDDVTYWKFGIDGTASGPAMMCGRDAIDDIITSMMMWAFAGDGTATTYTMMSQYLKTAPAPVTGTDDRAFQVIELTKSGVLIQTDGPDTSGQTMANAAAWQSMTGMSIPHTPTDANDPMIIMGSSHMSIAAPDGTGRARFWDGSAIIGPPEQHVNWCDAGNEFSNLLCAAGFEDAASAHTYVMQNAMVADVGAEISGDTTYGFWLQLLNLGIDAAGGAPTPKGPLGLPLHGPLGGPI